MIRVCVAGATGSVGRALVPAILSSSDLQLVGAVSRSHNGKKLGEVLGISNLGLVVSGSVEEALRTETDVLVDYTSPDVIKAHVLTAVRRGVHVVVGTSGLSDSDYDEIDQEAKRHEVGVFAGGNFAISAVLLQEFALTAARHMPSWEIFDYGPEGKIDAPSGTSRELAYRLSQVKRPDIRIPINQTRGLGESRGATLSGTQIHSVRLPGHMVGAEVIFGMPGERLIIRHEAGYGAEPYIAGTLLAVRKVPTFVGLKRGLDHIANLD